MRREEWTYTGTAYTLRVMFGILVIWVGGNCLYQFALGAYRNEAPPFLVFLLLPVVAAAAIGFRWVSASPRFRKATVIGLQREAMRRDALRHMGHPVDQYDPDRPPWFAPPPAGLPRIGGQVNVGVGRRLAPPTSTEGEPAESPAQTL